MSYLSRYKGVLQFADPLTAEQEIRLTIVLQQDVRDHPEWKHILRHADAEGYFYFTDLQITPDRTGLEVYSQLDGRNRTGEDVIVMLNFVTAYMREHGHEVGQQALFRLTGHLDAVTEEGALFRVKLDDEGRAFAVDVVVTEVI